MSTVVSVHEYTSSVYFLFFGITFTVTFQLIYCGTSTETIRLIRDGEKGGGGMEVGEEGDYILIATLSPPESLLH